MMINDLISRWRELHASNFESVHQEYDAIHPLRIFFGLDEKGNYEFFIRIENRPERIPGNNQSVNITIYSDADGNLTLCFQLIQSDKKDVFMHFCWDLVESSRDANSNTAALNKMLVRYGKWQKLMERGKNGLLSISEIKGLLGELLYLEELFQTRTIHGSVNAWMGPEGADRDFVFNDCWYEIKALDPSSSLIGISSIEQLDIDQSGELVLMIVELTAPGTNGAITLKLQIDHIREILKHYYGASLIFEDKLISAGYIDRPEYSEIFFMIHGKRRFYVDENFPALRRSFLDPCIAKAQYQLGIAGLANWEIK